MKNLRRALLGLKPAASALSIALSPFPRASRLYSSVFEAAADALAVPSSGWSFWRLPWRRAMVLGQFRRRRRDLEEKRCGRAGVADPLSWVEMGSSTQPRRCEAFFRPGASERHNVASSSVVRPAERRPGRRGGGAKIAGPSTVSMSTGTTATREAACARPVH